MFSALIPVARRVTALARHFWYDRRGIESVEWAVIAAIVIVVAVRGYGALSYSGIGGFFNGLAKGFSSLKITL